MVLVTYLFVIQVCIDLRVTITTVSLSTIFGTLALRMFSQFHYESCLSFCEKHADSSHIAKFNLEMRVGPTCGPLLQASNLQRGPGDGRCSYSADRAPNWFPFRVFAVTTVCLLRCVTPVFAKMATTGLVGCSWTVM